MNNYQTTMLGLNPTQNKEFGLMGVHIMAKVSLGSDMYTL